MRLSNEMLFNVKEEAFYRLLKHANGLSNKSTVKYAKIGLLNLDKLNEQQLLWVVMECLTDCTDFDVTNTADQILVNYVIFIERKENVKEISERTGDLLKEHVYNKLVWAGKTTVTSDIDEPYEIEHNKFVKGVLSDIIHKRQKFNAELEARSQNNSEDLDDFYEDFDDFSL